MNDEQVAGAFDYVPLEPARCDCESSDTLQLPVVTVMDRLRWAAFYGPFKCRKCRRKFYRRVKKKEFMES